jgi:HAD superfamily hydrolase (TIGR01459 family)
MKNITGISEIIDRYDHFIIDLWGVLHDGHDPYEGAIHALRSLKQNNKKIVLLSNAPRRANKAEATLEKLGFTKDTYDLLLTSGEVTYHYVKAHPELGKKYFYVGPDKDLHLLDGLGLTQVHEAKSADFAVATGFEGFGSKFEEKKHQLDECLASKLPLLVANPDKLVVKQTGEEQICAGIMGIYYTENGGKLHYFGKPHKNAYVECLEFFGTKDVGKILCIGDSLHTDIAGANMLGAGSLFVTGGIHKRDVYTNGKPDNAKLAELMKKENQQPQFLIDEFRWS